jgi:hypothetical protein
MTTLERRCRLLLRAYPAAYRQDRGEEIVGTLLEATPAGLSWPLARDVRGLIVGGMRARAALNRQRTTAANLRIAALIGATAYLAFSAVEDLSFVLSALVVRAHVAVWWPSLLAGAFVGGAVALAWLCNRRAVVLAGAIAAAVAVAASLGPAWPRGIAMIIVNLACLAALAGHAGRDGWPGRRWLWPLALVTAFPLLNYLVPGFWVTMFLWLLAVLGVVSLLWVVIDARPAVATAVFVLALWLPPGIAGFVTGPDIGQEVPLLIVIALAAVAVWRLRRQSARVSASHEL